MYKVTEEGEKILDAKVKMLISNFAKSNKKLKDEADEKIFDKFVVSKEFKEIKELMFANDNLKTKEDHNAFLGLIFAYTIEQINKEE